MKAENFDPIGHINDAPDTANDFQEVPPAGRGTPMQKEI